MTLAALPCGWAWEKPPRSSTIGGVLKLREAPTP
jgi:hypothetical protein